MLAYDVHCARLPSTDEYEMMHWLSFCCNRIERLMKAADSLGEIIVVHKRRLHRARAPQYFGQPRAPIMLYNCLFRVFCILECVSVRHKNAKPRVAGAPLAPDLTWGAYNSPQMVGDGQAQALSPDPTLGAYGASSRIRRSVSQYFPQFGANAAIDV